MGVYSQYSHDASSSETKKLWDPSKVLDIINRDPGYQCITCVGYAPSQGRRCRNPIRADNREFITMILDEIAYLQPDSSAIMSKLRKIAGLALCVRWHQNQADAVLEKWQQNIQQTRVRIKEQNQTRPARTTRRPDLNLDQDLENLWEEQREIREFLFESGWKFNGRWYRIQEQDREEKRQEDERREKKRREAEEDRQMRERRERARKEEEERERKRLEREQQEKQRQEKEEQERERAAYNERIRQRAQRRREEQERIAREKEQKEREERDDLWAKYEERWVKFRASTSREGNLRDHIPWPVRSGSYKDVDESSVKEFLDFAMPGNVNLRHLLTRKESVKWHPDHRRAWLRGAKLSAADNDVADMISRVANVLKDKASEERAAS